MLPPVCEALHEAGRNRICAYRHDNGHRRRGAPHGQGGSVEEGDDHLDLGADQLLRQAWQTIELAIGREVDEREIAAGLPTQRLEAILESLFCSSSRRRRQQHPNSPRRLGAQAQRPDCRTQCKQHQCAVAAFHSITSGNTEYANSSP